MAKFEVLKTFEAIKLNPRTLRPFTQERVTIPYGSIVSDVVEDRDNRRFTYLGQPYLSEGLEIQSALKVIPE